MQPHAHFVYPFRIEGRENKSLKEAGHSTAKIFGKLMKAIINKRKYWLVKSKFIWTIKEQKKKSTRLVEYFVNNENRLGLGKNSIATTIESQKSIYHIP